jgi:DNA polymerase-3 subunit gamma/tau
MTAERVAPVAEAKPPASVSSAGQPIAAMSAPNGFAEESHKTDGALAVAAEPALVNTSTPDSDSARTAVCAALNEASHSSAAQLLGSATWILEGAALRIEVPGIGKKMLALTVNAAAEKIIRQELQKLGAPSRFLVVPGAGAAASTSSAPTVPVAGSIQAEALKHPLVERAKEIFHAEVRSVVDLRQK